MLSHPDGLVIIHPDPAVGGFIGFATAARPERTTHIKPNDFITLTIHVLIVLIETASKITALHKKFTKELINTKII